MNATYVYFGFGWILREIRSRNEILFACFSLLSKNTPNTSKLCNSYRFGPKRAPINGMSDAVPSRYWKWGAIVPFCSVSRNMTFRNVPLPFHRVPLCMFQGGVAFPDIPLFLFISSTCLWLMSTENAITLLPSSSDMRKKIAEMCLCLPRSAHYHSWRYNQMQ